jgi:hypothetical protein
MSMAATSLAVNPIQGHYTWGGLVAFIVAAATLPTAWALLNRLSPWDDHEEMFERGNTGFTIVRALQVVALAYAVSPVIGYSTGQWWQQPLWAFADAIWACLLLALAALVISRMLRGVQGGLDGFKDCTVHVALVLGMFYVAFGLVIGAVLPGPGSAVVMSFAVSLVFSVLGVALIIVIYQVASTVRFFNGAGEDAAPGQRNLGDLIAEGDWAAAIIAATLVWTFGVVTNAAVAGSFTNWLDSILSFLVAAVIMAALTILTMWLVDRFVITRESVKDMIGNGHALPAAVMAAFLFAVAILVSYVVS